MSGPVRELIADVPAPGGDHRKDQPSTLCEQDAVEIRIVRADLVRHVRDVELDGSTAARLEVDEERAVRGVKDVARVRFAVQQLLVGAAATDPFPGVLQRAQEQAPVGRSECGGLLLVGDQPFSLGDAVQEVRRLDVDASKAGVQAVERVSVGGWCIQARQPPTRRRSRTSR